MAERDTMAGTLRHETAARIDRALRGHADLRAIARGASPLGSTDVGHAVAAVPETTIRELAAIANAVTEQTAADLTLASRRSRVYMKRWWLERQKTAHDHGQHGLYIHRFENDDPAKVHNHPWPSASLLLVGNVYENTANGTLEVNPGDILFRSANHYHRVTLPRGMRGEPVPAITLIATGLRKQAWELHHDDGSVSVNGKGRAADDR